MQSFSFAPREGLRAVPKAKQPSVGKPTRRIPQGLVLYESALDSFSRTGEQLGDVSKQQSPLAIDRIELRVQSVRDFISKDGNTDKKVQDFRYRVLSID